MPGVLILTTSHGSAHRRAGEAVKKALLECAPGIKVEIVDAVSRCSWWFRSYYDSYVIPLRYFPGLWRRIELRQQQGESTSPLWMYRLGGRRLFHFISEFEPDAVIATEVGVAELAAMHKRTSHAHYLLAGLELMDFNRAWVQPEIDLYSVVHADLGEELICAGAPTSKVLDSGMPIDPAFASLPGRGDARRRLGLDPGVPVVLVLFGGAGFGSAGRLSAALLGLKARYQAVFICGRNTALERELRRLARHRRGDGLPEWKVLGWVGNMHEWMAASDLVISKPGGATLMEAAACGLPFFAFDPLPGNEERTCAWIEKWGAGVWVREERQLAPAIEPVLRDPHLRAKLSEKARSIARPHASIDVAEAILKRLQERSAALRPSPKCVSFRGSHRGD